MANLIDIRRRIKSTKNTQQITKAMKMVSASRLRRASGKAISARPYAAKLLEVYQSILARVPDLEGGLYRQQAGKTLLVVVTADKGLCGSFNANIIKRAEQILRAQSRQGIALLPIGRKAAVYFAKRNVELAGKYIDVFREVNLELAETISHDLTGRFLSGEFARVVVLFNSFKNVLIQDVTEWELLPLTAEDSPHQAGPEHLAEPGQREILAEMAPKLIMTRVLQALLESVAAEHAARMTAMDAATNNAREMIEKLTLEMNKARQAAITKELIEVVSGAAAL